MADLAKLVDELLPLLLLPVVLPVVLLPKRKPNLMLFWLLPVITRSMLLKKSVQLLNWV